jgi:hypothetical protein
MKSLVMLAIVHSCQEPGNTQASDFEERLDYLRSKFDAQVILEEWADAEQSVTALWAKKLGLRWANIGTPDEARFQTFSGPINFRWHKGTLQPPDVHAPAIYEYGPFENQEAREKCIVKNIQAAMESHEAGLLVVGLAHTHSLFGKLQSAGLKVTAYTWCQLVEKERESDDGVIR